MTPPTPSRDTPAGRAYNDLRNLARRQNRDPAEYITLYALEGFLARLAASESASDFFLKGGVLMAAFAERRPTRDIDFAARGFANDIPEVEQRVRSILAVQRDDRLESDVGSVSGEQIQIRSTFHISKTAWERINHESTRLCTLVGRDVCRGPQVRSLSLRR